MIISHNCKNIKKYLPNFFKLINIVSVYENLIFVINEKEEN